MSQRLIFDQSHGYFLNESTQLEKCFVTLIENIFKKMVTLSTRLSDVVFRNIQLVNITRCFGINVQIAEKTINQICDENNIDKEFFLTIINTYDDPDYFPKMSEIDIVLLIDYLNRTHSFYIKFTLPHIERLLKDLQKKLKNEKVIRYIVKYFIEYKIGLIKHFQFEEEKLFPLILNLISDKKNTKAVSKSLFRRLKTEHMDVENKLSDLKTILVRYLPKKADEQTVFDLLFIIAGFEKNHFDHSRFEDKILIPKLKSLLRKKNPEK